MEQRKKIVPAPNGIPPGQIQPILNVEVEPEQELEWIWTHYPDGRSVVSGYRLVPKGKRE